jgi:16S rRNA (guanine(966)-N(2))-methyltransferase RsmD
MRIIGGTHRHRLIKLPTVRETRATRDAVREAIFSALGPRVPGALVLDLFAGSGAFGLEALSRGAQSAIMADHNDICVKTIADNVNDLKLEGAVLWHSNYEASLRRLSRDGIRPTLVFLDPPYFDKICEKIIEKLIADDLLGEHAIIVTETQKPLKIDEAKFALVRYYKYGITHVAILWR